MIRSPARAALIAFGLLAASAASAQDEPPKPAAGAEQRAPHRWTQGELVEVEVRTRSEVKERLEAPPESGERSEDMAYAQQMRFVYLDRIDEVKDGQATKVTRHYKVARMTIEGDELETELEGRQVVLTRAGERLQATWSDASPIDDMDLELIHSSLFVAANDGWRVELGARKGDLPLGKAGAETKTGPELPAALRRVLASFPLPLTAGTYAVQLEGALGPVGKLVANLALAGELVEEDEGQRYVTRTQADLKLEATLKKPSETALPTPNAPPVRAPEEEDYQGPQGPTPDPEGDGYGDDFGDEFRDR